MLLNSSYRDSTSIFSQKINGLAVRAFEPIVLFFIFFFLGLQKSTKVARREKMKGRGKILLKSNFMVVTIVAVCCLYFLMFSLNNNNNNKMCHIIKGQHSSIIQERRVRERERPIDIAKTIMRWCCYCYCYCYEKNISSKQRNHHTCNNNKSSYNNTNNNNKNKQKYEAKKNFNTNMCETM